MPLGGACDLCLDPAALYVRAEEEPHREECLFFPLVFSTWQALWGGGGKDHSESGDPMWLLSSHFPSILCFLPPWKENSQSSHK